MMSSIHSSSLSSPTQQQQNHPVATVASGSGSSSVATTTMIDSTNEPMRNYDGTEMRDANSCVVYKSQFLSTHPLRSDCKERVGYAGMKLTYVSGDGVIRTMNAIFGHGGWSSQITMERNILNEKDERGRWNVGYITSVRVTLLNGASHEDCGSGEGIDNSKIKAHEKAIKSAITDGMKRAARHFGERLGNALYVKGCGIRTAPKTNREALLELERKDALNLFGDQAVLRENHLHSPEDNQSSSDVSTASTTITASTTMSASTNNEVRNENWQQNHTGQTMNHVANSYSTRPSSNNAISEQQQQQQHQSGLTNASVLPSPIPSSKFTHGSSSHSHVASHTTHTLPNNAPRPPTLMAPPLRPIYNSVVGGTTNVTNNGKRSLVDGIENQYPMNNINDANNLNGSSTNNNGDKAKRLRVNPYNSKVENSNRLSV